MTEFKHKGKKYLRDVEMLGDVESIKWFRKELEVGEIGVLEIYDHDMLTELEESFESSIVQSITPPLSII